MMVANSQIAGFIMAAVSVVLLLIVYILMRFRYPRRKGVKADPLAEAEVYAAYGQTKRAIEILEKAVCAYPEREDLSKKLAELQNQ